MTRWLALWLLVLASAAWAQSPATPSCDARIVSVQAAKGARDGSRPTDAHWTPVALPDDWTRRWPDYSGSVWYRVDWTQTCRSGHPESLALALRSMVMAGEVFVNEHRIWRDAHLVEPLSRSWNMPRYWRIPDALVHDGANAIWVRVVGVAAQSPGLGPVSLGEPAAMQALYDDWQWHMRTLFMANLIASAMMSGLFFFAWLAHRRQDDYGWYALTNLMWALFASNVLATTPWPFPDTLMAARANIMFQVLHCACFCIFTLRFCGQRWRRAERVLWTGAATLLIMLAATPADHLRTALFAGFLVPAIVFTLNCLRFQWHALRSRRSDYWLLAACLMIFLVAGLHDLLILCNVIGGYPISPATGAIAMLGMSAVLGLRMARDKQRIERFNHELEESVEQARSELTTTLTREHALAVTNARLHERLEIAHDLHDGLGGSLVRMMAMVEQARVPLRNEQVLSLLKVIRNDLRQTIDSGTSVGIEVPATPMEWVVPLRHRFMQLFDELDIAAHWEIPRAWDARPSATQCLALTRFMEEAFANVIKHSRARIVQVRMFYPEADCLVLQIEDNGVGFDVAAVRVAAISVGMRSMHARIARVGGTLEVSSTPGHTVLAAKLMLRVEPAGA